MASLVPGSATTSRTSSTPSVKTPQSLVEDAIAAQFKRIVEAPHFRVSVGSAFSRPRLKEDYTFGVNSPISLKALIAQFFAAGNTSCTLLDLGPGSGSVLKSLMGYFGSKLQAFGVGAHVPDILGTEHYFPGNVERLQDIETLRKMSFDFIVSAGVMDFSVHPLGILEQAYRYLNKGGCLLVDRMTLLGLDGYEAPLIHYMRSRGYKIIAEAMPGTPRCAYSMMMILKSHDSLDFPALINPNQPLIGTNVCYAPTDDLQKMKSSHSVEISESKSRS